MEKVSIRNAKNDDAARVSDLSVQLEHPMSASEAQERISVILKDKNQALFVAEKDGKVMGFTSIYVNYELLSGIQARLGGLVVDSKARGMGLGSKLMKKAEEWAKAQGSKSVKLNSNVKRTEAHRFYEKNGYIKTKEQAAFKKIIR